MPYPFAHPAAVLPLARLMGRFAVPSALAIGSMVPDLWYFIPFLQRHHSHSLEGLALFCVPAGLIVYALFHLLLKQPLIALLSPRLRAFSPPKLPGVSWIAVVVSLLAGALTHLGWDALTHSSYGELFPRFNWLQHGSTVLGTAVLAWWGMQKLRAAAPAPEILSPRVRLCTILALLSVAAFAAFHAAEPPPPDLVALRRFARTAGFAALEALGVALFVYCLAFQRKMLRRAA
jgi:hypothetical protein